MFALSYAGASEAIWKWGPERWNWECWGSTSLWWRRGWPAGNTPQIIFFTHSCCFGVINDEWMNEFGRSSSNGTSIMKEIHLKNWPLASRLSSSLKVIEIDTDRSPTWQSCSWSVITMDPLDNTGCPQETIE